MKEKKQTILPSVHLLEIFMPFRNDERRMLDIIKRAVSIGYYRGVELGVYFDKYSRIAIRDILEQNDLNLAVFITPYLKERKMNLSSLDSELRKASVEYAVELARICADQGCTNMGIPSGDDPGDAGRKEAKKLLADSIAQIAGVCGKQGMNVTLEPLDRYAFKKQLIGPMRETVEWFTPIHKECPNVFIHWDSAHEALGKTDLMLSIEYASPYIAQFHLCDAILDASHPCFGDLHMDIGEAPDFETEGFLTPELGAKIINKISGCEKPAGVKNTYASIEVLGHPGDNMWHKEEASRLFLQKCFQLAEDME